MNHVKNISFKINTLYFYHNAKSVLQLNRGGRSASTQIAKPEVHVEEVILLVKHGYKHINANDGDFALAAA